ncbi:MAG: hypothetical protein KDK70_21860 [Myxococcales bacterium]|nr:hypothetical protein [Myxococcales bacterium]
MDHRSFDDWTRQACARGQARLAALTAGAVAELDPALTRALANAGPEPYLEPQLFAFLSRPRPELSLRQVLLHPTVQARGHAHARVHADARGSIVLPGLGHLRAEARDRALLLEWSEAGPRLLDGARAVACELEPWPRIAGTPFMLAPELPPDFAPLLAGPDGAPAQVEVTAGPDAERDRLARACELIAAFHPRYYARMLDAVRMVVVYRGEHPYSFASLSAHGAVFLNTRADASVVALVEDLVHQSGHVIFGAATVDRQALFCVDPDVPLSAISADGDGAHGLYESFHGLFTQVNINRCLRQLRRAGVFEGAERHELEGRISDDMKRFGAAIHILGNRAVYTELGWWLFSYFKRCFVALYSEQRALIEAHDTSNQPYIFSYARFLERNPRVLDASA